MKGSILFLSGVMVWVIVACCSPLPVDRGNIHLIPEPREVKEGKALSSLEQGYVIGTNDTGLRKLIPVISGEMWMLTGVRQKDPPGRFNGLSIQLGLNAAMGKEQYDLKVSGKKVVLQGGSYQAVAEGSVTLLQLINDNNKIPEVEISDSPAHAYRALMIDVARSWHSIGSLQQIVNLCRWYKIKYLQLHLTDDQSFTFPSKAYPLLPTKGRHYSWDRLVALDQYAARRGVTIIPELDVPSHSSSMIGAMPQLFGISDPRKNGNTISMGKDTVYRALSRIIGELVTVFPESPYIHLGTDEVFMGGMEDDPDTKRYMAAHGLHSLSDLYNSFIVRLADSVKSYGRQAIVWNGFEKGGKVKIPTDILVMEYLPFKYTPGDLVDDGYRVINASFKPLYNHWGKAADVYDHWNIFNWQIPRDDLPGQYKGIEIKPTPLVIGASMSTWAQSETEEVPSLRRKLAAMSERVWSSRKRDLASFMHDLSYTDKQFGRILSPVELSVKGLVDRDPDKDVQQFDSAVAIQMKSALPGIKLRYTTDGSMPGPDAPEYDTSLHFNKSIRLNVQAYDAGGRKVGFDVYRNYRFRPVQVMIKGAGVRGDVSPYNGGQVKFDDSVRVALQSKRGSEIKYALDGRLSAATSPAYAGPVKIDHTCGFTAQAFDAGGRPVGQPAYKSFVKIRKEASLTTGKPVSSSADRVDPRLAELAVDGEIMDNDYWSDVAGGWVKVDLEKQERIAEFKVYTFWDNYRYYQYVIEVSSDGDHWKKVVDFSHNTAVATADGYVNHITPVRARYIKITMLYNSANPIMHLVELGAFGSAADSIK